MSYLVQGFFSHWPKNSRSKKLKLKENFPETQGFLTKTQGFSAQKLNKTATLGQILLKCTKIGKNLVVFDENLEKFPKKSNIRK